MHELQQAIGSVPGVASVAEHHGAIWAEAPMMDPRLVAAALRPLHLRLSAITAMLQPETEETIVIYHFAADRRVVNFRAVTRGGALPSLAAGLRAASWAEREVADLFGVVFTDHPDPAPLLRPAGFAPGLMRTALRGPAASPISPTARFTPA